MATPVELSIIVPCYNEAENVLELAERAGAMFEARGVAGEVVFIDDASTDHTGRLIDDLAARHDFVRAVHHTANRGIPGGWESGVRAARGRWVAIMDGDLQYLPEDVYRLYRQLRYSNADVAQGWRSHIGRPRDFRYTMSRVLHWMLRVLFGLRLHDIKSGFLVCDRDVFAHILRRRFNYYYFQTFIAISAHHKGYRVEDVESLFEERKLGESFISAFPLKMILKNLIDVAKGFVEFRLLSRRTDVLGDFLARHPPARALPPLSPARRLYLRFFAALMPLHQWKLSYTALRYYFQLRRTQWMSPEEIRELQESRLRALIKHAHRHVPYYREMLDRLGVDPEEIRGLEDLRLLPPLSREAVRRNLHFDLISDSHDKRRMLSASTSGATGEPLVLYSDKSQLEMRWANELRNQEWTGYRFGDRQARPWSIDLERSRLRARLDDLLARRRVFSAIAMNADELRRVARLVRQWRPKVVQADTVALYLLGSLNEPGSSKGLPGAVSSGQTLSGEMRAAIETGLGTKVFDRYGSRGLGAVAQECEAHRGYHVNAESYVVEIVGADGGPARPGETGEVLITDLNDLSMPLIRFAIGDRGVATDRRCSCGRGLPLFESVQGRSPAVVIGANGRFVPAILFDDLLSAHGHLLKQFRVVQHGPGAIDLFIVKAARYSEPALERVLAPVRQHLGADTAIRVHPVEEMPASTGESPLPLVAPAVPEPEPAPAVEPHG